MMPVFVREPLQRPRGDSVKDVAVEGPFEDAENHVHRQKYREEREHAAGELARPQRGKEGAIAGKEEAELKQGEKRETRDGKASQALRHGRYVPAFSGNNGVGMVNPREWLSAGSVANSRI